METQQTTHIVCPWCGYTYSDTWERDLEDNEEQELNCEDCGKPFICSPEIKISYSTNRKPCADDAHQWEYSHPWEKRYKLKWLPESLEHYKEPLLKPEYFKVMNCAVCHKTDFVPITHEEYLELYKEHRIKHTPKPYPTRD